MTRAQLEHVFRVVTSLALPLSAAGCGKGSASTSKPASDAATFPAPGAHAGGAQEPTGTPGATATTVCSGPTYAPLDDLGLGVDYLALQHSAPSPEGKVYFSVTSGEACKSASKPDVCRQKLGALASSKNFRELPGYVPTASMMRLPEHEALVFTRGDEVGMGEDEAGILAVLGPIDTPKKAALLAHVRNHRFDCESPNVSAAQGGGFLLRTRTGGTCGPGSHLDEHEVLVTRDGKFEVKKTTVIEKGNPGCAIGRLPEGLREVWAPECDDDLGAFFARVAHLEAASVLAFERLELELRALDAPAALLRRVRRAARDERRHARVTGELARRYGAEVVAPEVQDGPLRDLEAVARENEMEGCVRETYGALVAGLQAERAADARIRACLRRIAKDETDHAALSWSLSAWARGRLDAAACQRLDQARAQAVRAMRADLQVAESEAVQRLAGMPTPAEAVLLFDTLMQQELAA